MNRRVEAEDPGADCFTSGALAVVLRVSRLAGAAPLHFVKKRTGWRVSLSPYLSFYGYAVVTVIILVTFGTLISDLQVDQKNSVRMRTNTRRVVWIVDASIMLLIAGAVVYGAPGQMRCMIRYLNYVQKINYELGIHHWPLSRERQKISFFIILMIITVLLTFVDYLLNCTFDVINAETWISAMYMSYYLCYWIMELREMQFFVITMHLLYSFKVINEKLKNLLCDLDSKKLHLIIPKRHKRRIESLNNININSVAIWEKRNSDEILKPTQLHHQTVRRLAQMYAATCDVVRAVDRCNGLVLLMLLGGFLFHLVCTPYYLINNMFEDQTSQSTTMHLINIVIQLMWCLFHGVNLLMVIEPCHLTHAEMENTRELVGHLTRCTSSSYDPLAVELELFFRHLILNQASYSPMKVTTMSRSLVATILGSITTYLVVIVQL